MFSRIPFVAVTVLSLFAWSDEPPATLENIARDAVYTLDPKPNYAHCTDPGDARQLTDGVLTEGHFWTQPSTVGWQAAWPVYVVLDLGAVKSIRGVSFRMAAGVAGVSWPRSIAIFVADAEKAFHAVGDLVALSRVHGEPAPEGYAVHRYWTDTLETHGRYVAFLVCSEPYTFCDEIEVYAGNPAWTGLAFADSPIEDLKVYADLYTVKWAVLKRIADDIDAVLLTGGSVRLAHVRRAIVQSVPAAQVMNVLSLRLIFPEIVLLSDMLRIAPSS
jgi:hypothetical protein